MLRESRPHFIDNPPHQRTKIERGAYDRQLPILEANSIRVLCRWFGITDNPKDTQVQNRLWELAETILPKSSGGDFNQSLMELGALVCTPTQPRCGDCPVRPDCQQIDVVARQRTSRRLSVTV